MCTIVYKTSGTARSAVRLHTRIDRVYVRMYAYVLVYKIIKGTMGPAVREVSSARGLCRRCCITGISSCTVSFSSTATNTWYYLVYYSTYVGNSYENMPIRACCVRRHRRTLCPWTAFRDGPTAQWRAHGKFEVFSIHWITTYKKRICVCVLLLNIIRVVCFLFSF